MSGARQLVEEAFAVEEQGFDLPAAVAGALGAAGPLAICIALNEPAIGIAAALGGLNAALALPRADLRRQLVWGALVVVGGAASVAAASAVMPSTWALVAATFAWTAVWAFLRIGGPTGALAGFVISAQFVIFAGLPAEGLGDGARTLWHLAGGVAGMALMMAARSVRARTAGLPEAEGPELTRAGVRIGLASLRAAFTGDRLLQAHAFRVAVILAATTLLYRELDLAHGYWIPLTVLAVLQPAEHASRIRAVQRAAGTAVGAGLVVVIVLLTSSQWAIVAAATLSSFALYGLLARGYFWLVVLLTPTVLLLTSALDYQSVEIAFDRATSSAAGVVIGLCWGELFWRLRLHRPAP